MTEYTKTDGGDCKLPRQPVLREEIQKGDKEGKGPPVLQKKKLDKRVSTFEKKKKKENDRKDLHAISRIHQNL